MNKEKLNEFLETRCISCTTLQADELEELMNSTLKTNEYFNLTAITDPFIFMEKMVLDSALGLFDIDLSGKKVIDIGTGAGYPGLVLYILNPQMKLTLLDSTKKKINYLNDYVTNKKWDVNCVSERIEEYGRNHRGEYDFVFARAVASLNILLELAMPLLKQGGKLVAMKGPDWEKEFVEAKSALKKMNCHLKKAYEETLPESEEKRAIVIIEKDQDSSLKYPRDFAEIKRKPL
jgi:16S rRNA (guanine527-N7)-methyltransferase